MIWVINVGLLVQSVTCGWAIPCLLVCVTSAGKSNVAQPLEYSTTSCKGERKPRVFADNVELTKSSTQISVHTPTTNSFKNQNTQGSRAIIICGSAILVSVYASLSIIG